MIEPIEGNKCCRKCAQIKLHSEFSALSTGVDGRHSYCKACRREYANRKTAEGVRSDYRPKREPKESPTAWMLPADPRCLVQKLLARTQAKWNYPVEPAQLTWRIA